MFIRRRQEMEDIVDCGTQAQRIAVAFQTDLILMDGECDPHLTLRSSTEKTGFIDRGYVGKYMKN